MAVATVDAKRGWESKMRLRIEQVRSTGDERILGSGQFVEQALSEDELG